MPWELYLCENNSIICLKLTSQEISHNKNYVVLNDGF